MPDLSLIAIEKQKHPTLSAESPFNIDYMYARKPTSTYSGDIHYALQLGIQLTGSSEIVYDNYSRICRPGDCWWTMCWEPHACKILEKRSFIVAVNLDKTAPIFDVAHYAVVGDVNEVLPRLIERVKEAKADV